MSTSSSTTPLKSTSRCVQNRAHLLQALYARRDHLTKPAPAATYDDAILDEGE